MKLDVVGLMSGVVVKVLRHDYQTLVVIGHNSTISRLWSTAFPNVAIAVVVKVTEKMYVNARMAVVMEIYLNPLGP